MFEGFDQHSVDCRRSAVYVLDIVLNLRIIYIELAFSEKVSSLRHSETHNLDAGIHHCLLDAAIVFVDGQEVRHGSNHDGLLGLSILLDNRLHPILILELLALLGSGPIGSVETAANDAPLLVVIEILLQNLVDVISLVGSVKVANADVQNRRRQSRTIVLGHTHALCFKFIKSLLGQCARLDGGRHVKARKRRNQRPIGSDARRKRRCGDTGGAQRRRW
mmetsp:Transcript_30062/g.70414  ORF Transcript_30062/g.70414 Transcript_30062/m.70414 type:complete len:220 (+) Transcript_30062:1785-2444(+)